MLLIKEEIFRGQLLSLLSLQHTDGEQHGVCGETKHLESKVSGGIGVYFHLGNWEISVLQYYAVEIPPAIKANYWNRSKQILSTGKAQCEDTSICLFNKQGMEIYNHS